MTLFLLFSHTLTPEQVADAQTRLGVSDFITLPPDLQAVFSNVPPDLPKLRAYLRPITQWLAAQARPNDYVLIHGDFGVVYRLVRFCKQHQLQAVYATTARVSVEMSQPDGTIKTERVFKHVMFRHYF